MSVGFDIIDRKLLFELDINSRQPVSALAKKLRLSKDAVKYRIQRLTDLGAIKSFNAIVDIGKLGFIGFSLLVKFYHFSPEKEKEIMDYLLSNPALGWLVQVQGDWHINTAFLYSSVKEMDSFWREFSSKYGNYIAQREIRIYSNVIYFGRAFLAGKKENDYRVQLISMSEPVVIDETDKQIITILENNARARIIDIASQTKLTPKTVIAKIRRLEKEKVIVAYRTEFDLAILGYKYYKITFSTFNLTIEKKKKFKQFLFAHPNSVYDDEVLGGEDIEFEIQIETDDAMRALVAEVREKFADVIKDYSVMQYYKEHKLKVFPKLY